MGGDAAREQEQDTHSVRHSNPPPCAACARARLVQQRTAARGRAPKHLAHALDNKCTHHARSPASLLLANHALTHGPRVQAVVQA